MKCQKCKSNEVEADSQSFEWGTDENGGPIQLSICLACSAAISAAIEDKKREQEASIKQNSAAAALRNVSGVLVTTAEDLRTHRVVRTLGPARGSTVRAKHVGRDIAAGLKNIVGGEIVGFTEMMAEAREEALYRMKLDAESFGANAVIAFRFTSATVDVGVAEVTAYGTAVWVEEHEHG